MSEDASSFLDDGAAMMIIMDYTREYTNVDDIITDLQHIRSRFGNIPVASYHGKKVCMRVNVKVATVDRYEYDEYDGKLQSSPTKYCDEVCIVGCESIDLKK